MLEITTAAVTDTDYGCLYKRMKLKCANNFWPFIASCAYVQYDTISQKSKHSNELPRNKYRPRFSPHQSPPLPTNLHGSENPYCPRCTKMTRCDAYLNDIPPRSASSVQCRSSAPHVKPVLSTRPIVHHYYIRYAPYIWTASVLSGMGMTLLI